jgi:hypothetical protein
MSILYSLLVNNNFKGFQIYYAFFIVSMKVVTSHKGATVVLLFVAATFLLHTRIASGENDDEYTDQLIAKIKQNIEQAEECEDSSVCKQSAENNLILCPIGSTCVFLTNDFIPYNLATPR